ncbi:hypothetical protein ES703_111515 [subsurface metagenome]
MDELHSVIGNVYRDLDYQHLFHHVRVVFLNTGPGEHIGGAGINLLIVDSSDNRIVASSIHDLLQIFLRVDPRSPHGKHGDDPSAG